MNRKEKEVMLEKWNSYGENSICKMEATEKGKKLKINNEMWNEKLHE